MTPLSVLGQMRRAMVAALDDCMRKPPDFPFPTNRFCPSLRRRVVACNHASLLTKKTCRAWLQATTLLVP